MLLILKVFQSRSLSALPFASYSALPIFQELRFGCVVVSRVLVV